MLDAFETFIFLFCHYNLGSVFVIVTSVFISCLTLTPIGAPLRPHAEHFAHIDGAALQTRTDLQLIAKFTNVPENQLSALKLPYYHHQSSRLSMMTMNSESGPTKGEGKYLRENGACCISNLNGYYWRRLKAMGYWLSKKH